ncbi:MAG: hypothetical protein K0Q96_898 [Rubrobacteraceae bacterium]|jgi:hypothetical protein|nr:hypothetical protein [Rubrobacteraceae bacterium]
MSEGAIVPREEGAELLARGSPGPIFGAIGRFASEAEESLVETIAMAEVLYVPVDDQGEPSRWAPEETGSVFKDIWRDQLSPQSKGSAMRDMRWRSCRSSFTSNPETRFYRRS